MISKKIECLDLGAAVAYVLEGRDKVSLILGSHPLLAVCPMDPTAPEASRILAGSLQAHDHLRPEIQRKWRHWSLSIEPGVTLPISTWNSVAKSFLGTQGIDLELHQAMVVLHQDKEHEHIHLFWSRIGANGSLARDRLP